MDLNQFEQHVDLYGSDLTIWPKEARISAEALLDRSTAARDLIAQAQGLEHMLSEYEVSPPTPSFEARLLDLAPSNHATAAHKVTRSGLWQRLNLPLLTSAGMGLASMAFGLFVGMSLPQNVSLEEEANAFVTAALSSGEDNAFWLEEDAG